MLQFMVPEHWVRKQTLVNAERYITEELKEYEQKILGAEDQILAIEQRLFSELIVWMHDYIKDVQQNAQLIAQLDCLVLLHIWPNSINIPNQNLMTLLI